MQGRSSVGLAIGLATIALVVAGLVATLTAGAGAAPTIVPGTYTITILGGSGNLHLSGLDIGPACSNGADDDLDGKIDTTGGTGGDGLPKPADPECASVTDHDEGTPDLPYQPPTFEVEIDAAGNISAPAADITWQSSPSRQDGGPLGIVNATIRFVSDDDTSGKAFVGTVDPATGRIDLTWRWHLETSANLPWPVGTITVRIGTATVPLTTELSTETTGGVRFDPLTLTTTLANDTMTVPAAACSGNGLACGQATAAANSQLGLPASVGDSALAVVAAFDRSPIAAGGDGAPDLTLSKAHVGDFVAGQEGAYTLTVSNVGTAATTAPVTLTESPPSGMEVLSMSGAGWTCDGTVCTHPGPVAAGAPAPPVTVTAKAAAAGEVTNTAGVSTAGDANSTNDSAQDVTTVAEPSSPAPDLAVTKSHAGDLTVAVPGTFTITVANVGTADAAGPVTVTDTLPPQFSAASATGPDWSCTPVLGSISCQHAGPVPAGAALPAVTVVATPDSEGDVVNTAAVAPVAGDPNPGNDAAADPAHVGAAVPPQAPDLALDKSHAGDTFTTGVPGTWTLTVSNAGSGPTTGAVTVTDTLPDDVPYQAAAGDGWDCGHADGTVTCTRSDAIGPGAAAPAVEVVAVPSAAGEVVNAATVTTVGDTDMLNDGDQDAVTVADPAPAAPDLAIAKFHDGDLTQGGTGAYTIRVANLGEADTSGVVTVTDTLPAGMDLVDADGVGWACGDDGGTVTCTTPGPLSPGSTLDDLVVKVTPDTPGDVVNTATVQTEGDADTVNDSASDPTRVLPAPPDLTVALTREGEFSVGVNSAFVMKVSNVGAGPTSEGIAAGLTLPSTLDYVGAAGEGWTCTKAERAVACTNPGPLAAGAALPVVNVVVRPNAAGDSVAAAEVATAGDTNADNDAALLTTQVAASAGTGDDDGDGTGDGDDTGGDGDGGGGGTLPVTGAEVGRMVLGALLAVAVGLGLLAAREIGGPGRAEIGRTARRRVQGSRRRRRTRYKDERRRLFDHADT